MKTVRRAAKPVSVCLIILLSVAFLPCQTLMAALVDVPTMIDADRLENARATIRATLAREDVKEALTSQGIEVTEAMARIDALTDAEVIALADRIDQLPAGGSGAGIIIGAAVVILVVLIITDIIGVTDVFTFVNKR